MTVLNNSVDFNWEEWILLRDAAKEFGVSPYTLNNWISQGIITNIGHTPGRRRLLNREELINVVNERKTNFKKESPDVEE